jgi:GWxTD domain-containing protein
MRVILSVFVSILFFYSCSSNKNAAGGNVFKYNTVTTKICPQIKIYNGIDGATTIYFKINSKNLTYKIRSELSSPETNLLVNCRIYADKNYSSFVDSALVIMKDKMMENIESELLFNLNCKLPEGKAYHLKIELTDYYADRTEYFNYIIDKTNQINRQYFLAVSAENNTPITSDYASTSDYIIVQNENFLGNKIFVRFYSRFFPLPPPPFAVYQPRPFNYKADSTFTIERNSNNQFVFNANNLGFYHLLVDTTQKEGFTIMRFPDNYPQLKTVNGMLESMRYLCSSEEYAEMSKSAADVQNAIETYWIKTSSTKQRAKENIKIYYNRVEESNALFSSYTQGWRTDRGLIYTIYGSPNIIYKSDVGEVWIYGEESNSLSVRFSFTKVINPFTDNDYRLIRDEVYKPSWYRIVENWRSGKAY